MERQSDKPKWTELALGSAIVVPGSARCNRTGDWRSIRPVWDLSKCVQCGVCVIFCPEGCITMEPRTADGFGGDGVEVKEGREAPPLYPSGDMTYCKGCGICARECWTACIAMVEEEE